jgi:hypothetical protein
MYCSYCGTLNDDRSAYCIGCGKPLAVPAPGQASATDPSGSGQPTGTRYLAQMVRGDHKHTTPDISLQDESGTQVMYAKRLSALHVGFELVDAKGQTVGRIDHETHLTKATFKIIDTSGSTSAVLQVQSIHSKGVMPKCWWEDKDGNRLGGVEFYEGILGYSLVRADGNAVFNVSTSLPGGIIQKLNELATKRYEVTLLDSSLPLPTLMGFIASLDSGLG